MKRFFNWQIILALILVLLSAIFYFIHYLIFRDAHHIFIYLLGDIAFLFLDVWIVMLVLHRLLVYREKQSILKKLNMVIGTFFSEVGTELLKKLSRFDPLSAEIGRQLVITKDWADRDFMKIARSIHTRQSDLNSKKEPLDDAKN